jgi:uncharacterized membrane protein YeaQ/YmgE (transglycosylase-associated protein family)
MSMLTWIVLGFLTAFVASKLFNKKREGVVLDFVVGIAGAIFGGYVFSAWIARGGLTTFSFFGLLVAVAGAAMFLAMRRALYRSEF